MAATDVQDAAAKERIMKHMNADHKESIRRYVEAGENKSFYQVRDARMTDINLDNIKISYAGKQAIIPFDPPMKTFREARERLVQMDKDSLQVLRRSDISITKYISPYAHIGHLFNFSQCFLTMAVFCRSSNFKAGSLLFDNVLFRIPGFVTFCLAIQPYLFGLMFCIHAFESTLMVRKLAKHGLTPFESIWWCWLGSCFVEGVTSFWRLDEHLAEKKREKEAKKH